MNKRIRERVERKYLTFRECLPDLLISNPGKYALMGDGEIIEFFDTARDAYIARMKMFKCQTVPFKKLWKNQWTWDSIPMPSLSNRLDPSLGPIINLGIMPTAIDERADLSAFRMFPTLLDTCASVTCVSAPVVCESGLGPVSYSIELILLEKA